MPRGNDPDAAREFAEQYDTTGNAEDLIRANRAARADKRLRIALRLGRNEEATAKLTDAKRSEAAKKLGVDVERVLDLAVRGEYTVASYEDSRGRARKAVVAGPDEELSDDEKAAREREAEEVKRAQDARERREQAEAEAEKAAAEARAKADESTAKAAASQK